MTPPHIRRGFSGNTYPQPGTSIGAQRDANGNLLPDATGISQMEQDATSDEFFRTGKIRRGPAATAQSQPGGPGVYTPRPTPGTPGTGQPQPQPMPLPQPTLPAPDVATYAGREATPSTAPEKTPTGYVAPVPAQGANGTAQTKSVPTTVNPTQAVRDRFAANGLDFDKMTPDQRAAAIRGWGNSGNVGTVVAREAAPGTVAPDAQTQAQVAKTGTVTIDPRYVAKGDSPVGFVNNGKSDKTANPTATTGRIADNTGDRTAQVAAAANQTAPFLDNEMQRQLVAKYPEIGKAGSPENQAFLKAYTQGFDPSKPTTLDQLSTLAGGVYQKPDTVTAQTTPPAPAAHPPAPAAGAAPVSVTSTNLANQPVVNAINKSAAPTPGPTFGKYTFEAPGTEPAVDVGKYALGGTSGPSIASASAPQPATPMSASVPGKFTASSGLSLGNGINIGGGNPLATPGAKPDGTASDQTKALASGVKPLENQLPTLGSEPSPSAAPGGATPQAPPTADDQKKKNGTPFADASQPSGFSFA